MSENKKGQGSSSNNFQGTNKNPNELYHERQKEIKLDVEVVVRVLRNALNKYDEEKAKELDKGKEWIVDEGILIASLRRAVEILEHSRMVYEKVRYDDERLVPSRMLERNVAQNMMPNLIDYIEFTEKECFETCQREVT